MNHHDWYEVILTVEGAPGIARHGAGRSKTGRLLRSDPVMEHEPIS